MKKRIILLLFVGIFAGQLLASNHGTCGNGVNWNLDSNSDELVISGKGAIDNYEFPDDASPWNRLAVKHLVIGEGITEIGSYAFYYCENLSSIQLPTSLKRIGMFAFTCCYVLDNVYLPAQVNVIENSAFCQCHKIKNLTIASDSTDIAPYAFGFCENLKEQTYKAKGRTISSLAFINNGMTKTINNNVVPDTDEGIDQ